MKLKMSENLRKQIEAQIRYDGHSNSSFVQKVNAMLKKEFKDDYDAQEYANKLGLGRTIVMGNMGLIKI